MHYAKLLQQNIAQAGLDARKPLKLPSLQIELPDDDAEPPRKAPRLGDKSYDDDDIDPGDDADEEL